MTADEIVLYFSIFVGVCVFVWLVFIAWMYRKMDN